MIISLQRAVMEPNDPPESTDCRTHPDGASGIQEPSQPWLSQPHMALHPRARSGTPGRNPSLAGSFARGTSHFEAMSLGKADDEHPQLCLSVLSLTIYSPSLVFY